MSNISGVIKSIQDIMRKDVGVDGDAQRIGQLVCRQCRRLDG
jgi:type I restriction enzyme M protein